jgi:hypothetical protein
LTQISYYEISSFANKTNIYSDLSSSSAQFSGHRLLKAPNKPYANYGWTRLQLCYQIYFFTGSERKRLSKTQSQRTNLERPSIRKSRPNAKFMSVNIIWVNYVFDPKTIIDWFFAAARLDGSKETYQQQYHFCRPFSFSSDIWDGIEKISCAVGRVNTFIILHTK